MFSTKIIFVALIGLLVIGCGSSEEAKGPAVQTVDAKTVDEGIKKVEPSAGTLNSGKDAIIDPNNLPEDVK
jgi:hypothetical protein